MVKILIGVVAAAFVIIIGFMIIDPELNTAANESIVEVTSIDSFKFTIEGQVFKAGTYILSESATMGDLIDAAGGLTESADTLAFFETASLSSGNSYYIASKYDDTDVCSVSEIVKVNINEDDVSTLTTINGITTSIASSIVSYRAENGVFDTIEELMDVYGIGNATYKKVRNYVTLHS